MNGMVKWAEEQRKNYREMGIGAAGAVAGGAVGAFSGKQVGKAIGGRRAEGPAFAETKDYLEKLERINPDSAFVSDLNARMANPAEEMMYKGMKDFGKFKGGKVGMLAGGLGGAAALGGLAYAGARHQSQEKTASLVKLAYDYSNCLAMK
jgi:hypothetical protein